MRSAFSFLSERLLKIYAYAACVFSVHIGGNWGMSGKSDLFSIKYISRF